MLDELNEVNKHIIFTGMDLNRGEITDELAIDLGALNE